MDPLVGVSFKDETEGLYRNIPDFSEYRLDVLKGGVSLPLECDREEEACCNSQPMDPRPWPSSISWAIWMVSSRRELRELRRDKYADAICRW